MLMVLVIWAGRLSRTGVEITLKYGLGAVYEFLRRRTYFLPTTHVFQVNS